MVYNIIQPMIYSINSALHSVSLHTCSNFDLTLIKAIGCFFETKCIVNTVI